MTKSTLILAGILTLGVALVGCNGATEEPATTDTPTTSSTESSDAGMETASTDAEKVSCDKCGMEMAKEDAHEHDGKMLCEHCVESA
ncbi:MAG: hypothetical protein R2688_06145 [Fimbriimonadaceae bacterium]